jgi:hypothetical protein
MEISKKAMSKEKLNRKIRRSGVLPGSNRHLVHALPPSIRPSAPLLLALGGWSFAGAGLRGQSLILSPPGGQVVQELLSNFGLQGNRALHNLRVFTG